MAGPMEIEEKYAKCPKSSTERALTQINEACKEACDKTFQNYKIEKAIVGLPFYDFSFACVNNGILEGDDCVVKYGKDTILCKKH